MRGKADFIRNLQIVRTHLLILTGDIKYPLSEERQIWLDGANLLIKHLFNEILKEDIETALGTSVGDEWLEGASLLIKRPFNEILKEDIEVALGVVGDGQQGEGEGGV